MFKKKFHEIIESWAGSYSRRASNWVFMGMLFPSLIFFTGCETIQAPQPVNLADGDWSLHQGQVIWRARKGAAEIAGELALATNVGGRVFLQFTKTPVPFLVAQSATNFWQLHSVPNNKTYSGRGTPPIRVIWLWLPRCLAGTTPPRPLSWKREENANWRLQNDVTGEFLEGYLNP